MGAFVVMSLGYFFTGISDSYFAVFTSLMLVALGAGFFKPIISGTIARSTNEDNSALGFGIFYWVINLGAFLVPLILIPILKGISYSYIFYMAAIATGSMLLLNLFVFKEPKREQSTKSVLTVFKEALLVIKDVRFIALIGIYSCFWILYFQMNGSVLWYVRDYVDASSLNIAIKKFYRYLSIIQIGSSMWSTSPSSMPEP
jgi:dipeptide/tripeptide permease